MYRCGLDQACDDAIAANETGAEGSKAGEDRPLRGLRRMVQEDSALTAGRLPQDYRCCLGQAGSLYGCQAPLLRNLPTVSPNLCS